MSEPNPATKSILQEAYELVNGARQADYGHPLDNFTTAAALWSALLKHPVSAREVVMCMIALKLSREIHKPTHDNLVDGAGYFACLELMDQEAARRHVKS